jgi:cytochrome c oxidase subunit I+III
MATFEQALARDEQDAEFDRVWRSPPGLLGWFTHVNQQRIGRRYIFTSFLNFLLAGLLAILIRIQLASAEQDFLGPELFNRLFTMHGTAMMFLFAVPMVEGLGIYLVPLMLGTRDLAFPRLSAFSYYVFLIGSVVLWVSLLVGAAPDTGWFSYVPLALKEFSGGKGVDVYATVVTFIEVSALAAAVELIVTIFKQRAPGMSLNRMPIFVWSILVMAFMIVFAMPGVIVGTVMLALDRLVDTRFYSPPSGGDPVLWQHLFWWFGHPDVYIIFVPATGVVSTLIPVFARRPLVGYTWVVLSIIATGIISFGLWVHHMFTVGLPAHADSFFSAASIMIAVPTGIQVFAWIATLWSGRPRLRAPLLFCVGFILIFVLGGLTGVMLASVPFDKQVHDTYFVVAHFHYVLIGGVVFPILAGLHYWWPKLTGKVMSEGLARWSFWATFVGFNVAFFPLHIVGFQGMPRRVYTYEAGLDWESSNLISTLGAFLLGLGVLLVVANMAWSTLKEEAAADDPWGADTLEWSIPSPPPNGNFRHLPAVEGRHPLWQRDPTAPVPVVSGLRTDRREVLATTVMDARPDAVVVLPGPTPWPFLMALASTVGFVGSIFHPALFVVGFFLAFLATLGWLWPRRPWRED